jgi:EAL domain-containing protein (putative c-di-GMP-specific phosphodiesterase class I)
VAVNLSPRQFHQPDLYERIKEILSETGLAPHRLELEITEGALMDHSGMAASKLAALKGLGVRLSIDDFGTGYSSLAYLKHFSIDKLKVDQSFVRDITHDGAGMEITTAIIGLAKCLKLEVLAEGVETETQLDFLRTQSCDSAQGFLFGRPVPSHELQASDKPGVLSRRFA